MLCSPPTTDPKKKERLDIKIHVKDKDFVVTAADENDRAEWVKALSSAISIAQIAAQSLSVSRFDGRSRTATVSIKASGKLAALTGV